MIRKWVAAERLRSTSLDLGGRVGKTQPMGELESDQPQWRLARGQWLSGVAGRVGRRWFAKWSGTGERLHGSTRAGLLARSRDIRSGYHCEQAPQVRSERLDSRRRPRGLSLEFCA